MTVRLLKIERELQQAYEQHFKISMNDKSHRLFTREEQIERYGGNFAFWANFVLKQSKKLKDEGKDDIEINKDLKMIVINDRLHNFNQHIKTNLGEIYIDILAHAKKT